GRPADGGPRAVHPPRTAVPGRGRSAPPRSGSCHRPVRIGAALRGRSDVLPPGPDRRGCRDRTPPRRAGDPPPEGDRSAEGQPCARCPPQRRGRPRARGPARPRERGAAGGVDSRRARRLRAPGRGPEAARPRPRQRGPVVPRRQDRPARGPHRRDDGLHARGGAEEGAMGPRGRAVPPAPPAAPRVPPLASAQAVDPDPRPGLRAFEAVLAGAIARVSRMSVSVFFPAADACHGYRLPGYGAVFIVPPRALPPGRRSLNVRRLGPVPAPLAADGADQDAAPGPEPTPTPRAAAPMPARHGGGKPAPDAVELEIRRFEAQMEEYQRQAQIVNQIAEQQIRDFYRTVHRREGGDAGAAPTLVQGPTGGSDD